MLIKDCYQENHCKPRVRAHKSFFYDFLILAQHCDFIAETLDAIQAKKFSANNFETIINQNKLLFHLLIIYLRYYSFFSS